MAAKAKPRALSLGKLGQSGQLNRSRCHLPSLPSTPTTASLPSEPGSPASPASPSSTSSSSSSQALAFPPRRSAASIVAHSATRPRLPQSQQLPPMGKTKLGGTTAKTRSQGMAATTGMLRPSRLSLQHSASSPSLGQQPRQAAHGQLGLFFHCPADVGLGIDGDIGRQPRPASAAASRQPFQIAQLSEDGPDLCCICCQVGLHCQRGGPKALPCGHTFHAQCIDAWFEWETNSGRGRTCPLCRCIVPEDSQLVAFAPAIGLLRDAMGHAIPILRYLHVHDVVAFHLGSKDAFSLCRSSASGRLLIPTLFLNRCKFSRVDLASVEVVYADDAQLVTHLQNDEFSKCLGACASLRELYCSYNPRLAVPFLGRALICLPRLVVLDLSHNDLAVEARGIIRREVSLDVIFDALSPLLQVLDLSHNHMRDMHAEKLVEVLEARHIAGGCGIQQLRLRSNYLGNYAACAFGMLMRSPAGANLWRLDMRTNRVDQEGACSMLSALYENPCMKEIRVGYNRQNSTQDLETARLASSLLQRALSSKSCNRLEMIDLSNVRFGDEGMKRMAPALALNTLLKRLDVAFNDIRSEGAQALAAALERNRNLESLDLRDNEMGDDGAQALALGLAQNSSLRKLQIARNEIGTRGGLALMNAIHGNKKIDIDFGAGAHRLQGLMKKNPSLADYRAIREAERELRSESTEGLTSLMFSY